MKIKNKDELITQFNNGNSIEFLLFWGHQKPKSGVSKSCFSQWFESPFSYKGDHYRTAEHYMMAEKARLFEDEVIRQKIMASKKPSEAKKLGRKVRNFDNKIWLDNRFEIVRKASYLKFSQNEPFKHFLLSTENKVLVEASPVDPIWGIGLSMDNRKAQNPNEWKGLNLLGFALMHAREEIKKDATNAENGHT
ncbi:MAG TPA: NADAR family protein [Leucothrix sp.]|nr:NADAR family protein [Leucothrix sp.]